MPLLPPAALMSATGAVGYVLVLLVPRMYVVGAISAGGDGLGGVPISAAPVAGRVRRCPLSAVFSTAAPLAGGYGNLVS